MQPGVFFVSDSDPNFLAYVFAALGLPFTTVDETGGLQDVSLPLGTVPSEMSVQVLSEIPEPGTLVFGIGLLGMAAHARRVRS